MTALFGVPLCGVCFVPLAVGVATFIFLWLFVFPKKSLPSPVSSSSDELQKAGRPVEVTPQETKEKTKDKKKAACGGNAGCCSKKNGKSGACSPKNKAIETAKVFVDECSSVCKDFAEVLAEQFSVVSLRTELLRSSEFDMTDLSKHTDGSLCVFLMDTSIGNEHNHWLQKAISNSSCTEKPLAGMMYTVFMFQSAPVDKSKADVADLLLHKSGAVRVCRADSMDRTSIVSSSHFGDWIRELLDRIQKWNEPKRKGCKCGPTKKKKSVDGDRGDQSCSSSNCSDSEVDNKSNSVSKPILDLEDIGKLL